MSVRLGNIAGPFIGALLTTVFDIRSIFQFNVDTKLAVLVITFFSLRRHDRNRLNPKNNFRFLNLGVPYPT